MRFCISPHLRSAALVLALSLMPSGLATADDELQGGPVESRANGHEPDTYRFGYPYRSSRGTSPRDCERLCNRETQCASWSLTPATFRLGPRCELKRNIGSASYRPGAVSGVSVKYDPRQQTTKAVISAPPPSPEPAPTRQPLRAPVRRPALTQTAPSEVNVIRPRTDPADSDLMGAPPVAGRVMAVQPQPATPLNAVTRQVPVSTPEPLPALDAVTRQRPRTVSVVAQPVTKSEITSIAEPTPPSVTPDAAGGVQIYPPPPPIQPRKPWTERGDEADYSVQDMDYIPGDEQATAGLVEAPQP